MSDIAMRGKFDPRFEACLHSYTPHAKRAMMRLTETSTQFQRHPTTHVAIKIRQMLGFANTILAENYDLAGNIAMTVLFY